jgi:hypothetical protein
MSSGGNKIEVDDEMSLALSSRDKLAALHHPLRDGEHMTRQDKVLLAEGPVDDMESTADEDEGVNCT